MPDRAVSLPFPAALQNPSGPEFREGSTADPERAAEQKVATNRTALADTGLPAELDETGP